MLDGKPRYIVNTIWSVCDELGGNLISITLHLWVIEKPTHPLSLSLSPYTYITHKKNFPFKGLFRVHSSDSFHWIAQSKSSQKPGTVPDIAPLNNFTEYREKLASFAQIKRKIKNGINICNTNVLIIVNVFWIENSILFRKGYFM